jgi:hypothetical protein
VDGGDELGGPHARRMREEDRGERPVLRAFGFGVKAGEGRAAGAVDLEVEGFDRGRGGIDRGQDGVGRVLGDESLFRGPEGVEVVGRGEGRLDLFRVEAGAGGGEDFLAREQLEAEEARLVERRGHVGGERARVARGEGRAEAVPGDLVGQLGRRVLGGGGGDVEGDFVADVVHRVGVVGGDEVGGLGRGGGREGPGGQDERRDDPAVTCVHGREFNESARADQRVAGRAPRRARRNRRGRSSRSRRRRTARGFSPAFSWAGV